ncbi:MAG TPA: hypothetical protein VIG99_09350 [Myxococcaceae bacterium]|jgi:hypothetical protein
MRAARAPAVALAFAASLAVGAEPPPEPPESDADAEDAPEPLAPGASAAMEPWTVVSSRPILLRTRARKESRVREVWASAVFSVPGEFVQEALLDGERFPRFMPYVQEVRMLKVPTPDGSWLTYQRVAPPLVAPRDVVFQVWMDSSLEDEGSLRFHNHWEAVPGMVPSAPGAVRTPISSGSWDVKRMPAGQCRATYRFIVDPGGNIPTWLADLGNRTGIPELFKALEKEAKRRAAEPHAPRPKAPAPPPEPTAKAAGGAEVASPASP